MRGKDLIMSTLLGGGSSGGGGGAGGIPQADIDAAFAALAEKGVTVPDGATSADLDDLIASIVTGGGSGVWVQSGTFVCENTTSPNSKGAPVDDSNGEPQLLFFFKDSDTSVKGDVAKENLSVSANLSAVGGHTLVYGISYYSNSFSKECLYTPFVLDENTTLYKLDNGEYYVTNPGMILNTKFMAGVKYCWIAIGGLSE